LPVSSPVQIIYRIVSYMQASDDGWRSLRCEIAC